MTATVTEVQAAFEVETSLGAFTVRLTGPKHGEATSVDVLTVNRIPYAIREMTWTRGSDGTVYPRGGWGTVSRVGSSGEVTENARRKLYKAVIEAVEKVYADPIRVEHAGRVVFLQGVIARSEREITSREEQIARLRAEIYGEQDVVIACQTAISEMETVGAQAWHERVEARRAEGRACGEAQISESRPRYTALSIIRRKADEQLRLLRQRPGGELIDAGEVAYLSAQLTVFDQEEQRQRDAGVWFSS